MKKIKNKIPEPITDKDGKLLLVPTLRLLANKNPAEKLRLLKELIRKSKWEDPSFINKYIDVFAQSLINHCEKNHYIQGYCTGFRKHNKEIVSHV